METRVYYFGITLKSRQVCSDWDATQAVLRRTLRSIHRLGENTRILIACHEPPDVDDPNVTLLPVGFPVPKTLNEKKQDQFLKYFSLGMAVRDFGGGHFMAMDFDDLVSRALLSYVLENPSPNGYLFSYGWVWEEPTNKLYPIPFQDPDDGRLKQLIARRLLRLDYRFDLACGTCAMFLFSPDELPSYPYEPCRFTELFAAGHHRWRDISVEMGRPLHVVPRRLVTYVSGLADSVSVEAGENVSIGSSRRGPLRRLIASHSLLQGYCDEFAIGWPI